MMSVISSLWASFLAKFLDAPSFPFTLRVIPVTPLTKTMIFDARASLPSIWTHRAGSTDFATRASLTIVTLEHHIPRRSSTFSITILLILPLPLYHHSMRQKRQNARNLYKNLPDCYYISSITNIIRRLSISHISRRESLRAPTSPHRHHHTDIWYMKG